MDEELLVEPQRIDHPPGLSRPRAGHGPKHKDDDGGPQQYPPRLGFERPHEPGDQEHHDGHGAEEDDLLVVWDISEAHDQGEGHEDQAAAQDPPVGRGQLGTPVDHLLGGGVVVAVGAQALELAPLEHPAEDDAGDRGHWDQEREFIDPDIGAELLGLVHGLYAVEQEDVEQGHEDTAADDGDPPQGLHGGVHEPLGLGREGVAVPIDRRDRLHRHGIGHHVLDHIARGRQKHAQDVPGRHRHQGAHGLGPGEQAQHDQQARGDQRGPQIDQGGLVAPDQVHQVADGHLQRPGDHGPEAQGRQELRREAEVVLDEEGPDDGRQARDPRRQIDHQRGQIGQAQLPPQLQDVAVEPVVGSVSAWGGRIPWVGGKLAKTGD